MQRQEGRNVLAAKKLAAIAEAQAGFFTAKQAERAGYSATSHSYHVRLGH
jgi:hypothetical protein